VRDGTTTDLGQETGALEVVVDLRVMRPFRHLALDAFVVSIAHRRLSPRSSFALALLRSSV